MLMLLDVDASAKLICSIFSTNSYNLKILKQIKTNSGPPTKTCKQMGAEVAGQSYQKYQVDFMQF